VGVSGEAVQPRREVAASEAGKYTRVYRCGTRIGGPLLRCRHAGRGAGHERRFVRPALKSRLWDYGSALLSASASAAAGASQHR
jgi:hypothetical protein